ncbi:hypothetical protein [Solirubrum puertoriconensis]|nr:hypothetical protein [Solirubrum puertoriconensis]
MKRILLLLLVCSTYKSYSQKVLTSWSQQNIENYTKDMYDEAQKLTSAQLLIKNANDTSWSDVFLTLNASVNNYSKDIGYLKALAAQVINTKETKLQGTSRLIIWNRVVSGDIVFEGKGLIIDNDLYKVGGRANQLLQSLTNKNFGFVTVNSTEKQLKIISNKWLDYLSGKPVEEYRIDKNENAKIPEISNLEAVEALIVSLQPNSTKENITKNCLKRVYNLEEMPSEKGSQANYCNPDTYTSAYLGILFGDEKVSNIKDAIWWKNFWLANHSNLVWNAEKGFYEVKKL